MKKKIIIIIAILILTIVITTITILNNKTISTITLDINPSIEINLTKNEKIKNIKPLNEDAKEIIDNNLKGKTIEEALEFISNKIIEKDYIEDNHIAIIIHTTGKIKNEKIESIIRDNFAEKEIDIYIINIENITKEDEDLAKEYNITLAKASYINSILKENENIKKEDLINKSVNELDETKTTGNYCQDGYTLEGDWCLKEKERKQTIKGEVCPIGYYEYDENCYEETPIEHTNNLYCGEEFTLKENKCVRTITMDAEPSKYTCPYGEETTKYKAGLTNNDAGDANDITCVDTSNATHPVSPCETHDGTEYTMVNGTCYWHRAPVIESGCPGKIQVNGMCWDDASNIFICEGYRDGKRYSSRNEYCENSIKYIEPIISEYKCPEDFTLENNKCVKKEIEEAQHEQRCPNGYTLVNNDRCINYNNVKNKENGYICNEENMRLKGNECILYEMVEALHN